MARGTVLVEHGADGCLAVFWVSGAAGAGKQALPTGANQQITPLPARARRPASALPKQAALAPASRLPQASGRPAALGGAAPHASLIRPGSALRAQRYAPIRCNTRLH